MKSNYVVFILRTVNKQGAFNNYANKKNQVISICFIRNSRQRFLPTFDPKTRIERVKSGIFGESIGIWQRDGFPMHQRFKKQADFFCSQTVNSQTARGVTYIFQTAKASVFVKFICSEKATKFEEISLLVLTLVNK